MNDATSVFNRKSNRRKFLKNGMLAAGAATVGAGLLPGKLSAFGRDDDETGRSCPNHQRRHRDSYLPKRSRANRRGSLASVLRTRRHSGQRSFRTQRRKFALHRRPFDSRRRHGPIHPRQHRRRNQPSSLSEQLSRLERRQENRLEQICHSPQQQSRRRKANRPPHKSHAAHCRH